MGTGTITLLLFSSLLALLLTGMPLAFCLSVVSVIFTIFLWGPAALFQIASTTFGYTLNIILVAIPLFVFMANILQISDIADDLYDTFYRWTGRLNGGLAAGTVGICGIFAAMSGLSGAATVSMGLIAIPSMLKRGYEKKLAVGCVAAGGALGILIPPSVVMIIYAVFCGVSVGKLFVAGVLPGILLASMFVAYIMIRCYFNPELGPSVPEAERCSFIEKVQSLKSIVLPSLLIVAVIGSIFFGLATPTEAAAVGAIGSLLCALAKRKLSWVRFKEACEKTLILSTMIMWIVIGASCFASVYTALGAPDFLNDIIVGTGLGKWSILIILQLTYFVLGMLMDPTGIVMITTPVYIPIITSLGFDPIWFGILFIINMEMGYITPPFGYNLFYMSSIVPRHVMSMKQIYVSVFPFIVIQAICLILLVLFPQIALWLPSLMG